MHSVLSGFTDLTHVMFLFGEIIDVHYTKKYLISLISAVGIKLILSSLNYMSNDFSDVRY